MPDGDAGVIRPTTVSPVGPDRAFTPPSGISFCLLLLLLGSTDRRQGDGMNDIVGRYATGQVVHRLAHTLRHQGYDGDRGSAERCTALWVVLPVFQIRENEHTVARPATGEFGALVSAMTAASYCNADRRSSGRTFSCARRVASRTFSTSLPAPEVPVE